MKTKKMKKMRRMMNNRLILARPRRRTRAQLLMTMTIFSKKRKRIREEQVILNSKYAVNSDQIVADAVTSVASIVRFSTSCTAKAV